MTIARLERSRNCDSTEDGTIHSARKGTSGRDNITRVTFELNVLENKKKVASRRGCRKEHAWLGKWSEMRHGTRGKHEAIQAGRIQVRGSKATWPRRSPLPKLEKKKGSERRSVEATCNFKETFLNFKAVRLGKSIRKMGL